MPASSIDVDIVAIHIYWQSVNLTALIWLPADHRCNVMPVYTFGDFWSLAD